MSRLLALAIAAALLSGCLSGRQAPQLPSPPKNVPVSGGDNAAKTRPYEIFGQVYYPIPDASGYRERGVASWYGGKFHGRRTANGEHYDMHQLTAAHKTLPLPTWVRVTNLRNGATVDVRVNDRGPFVKNRLIDLSYAAAMQIGMVEDGTTLVEVEVLGAAAPPKTANVVTTAVTPAPPGQVGDTTTGSIPPTGRMPAPQAAEIYVQVGAFGDGANAERLRSTLYNAGVARVRMSDGDIQGAPVYRVRVGPVLGVDDYDAVIVQLESLGIFDTHLVTE